LVHEWKENHHFWGISESDGISGYSYDAAGNMTHDATTNTNYSFDQENRITGAGAYTYTYDADGNRVEKSTGGSSPTGTLYWYMSPGIVAESDLTGPLKSEYVFFDGERVARKDFSGSTTSVFYYFSDHLKTASVITDSAGTIKAESDYYPWGGELQFVNNDSNHYKFTGKERDSETGLDYFGARYYGNWLGRWMSPDWAGKPEPVPYANLADPQTLNLYGYVRNIPTSKADADGHCCWKEFKNWWKYNHWIADEAEAKRLSEADKKWADQWWKENGAAAITATSVSIAYWGATTDVVVATSTNAAANNAAAVSEAEATVEAVPPARLPQDKTVNPVPPRANNGNGTVGPNANQNVQLKADIAAARAQGATDIRVNQQQVSAQGVRVGINRPDLQYTLNGTRYIVEYESSNPGRSAAHTERIGANDPNAVVTVKYVK